MDWTLGWAPHALSNLRTSSTGGPQVPMGLDEFLKWFYRTHTWAFSVTAGIGADSAAGSLGLAGTDSNDGDGAGDPGTLTVTDERDHLIKPVRQFGVGFGASTVEGPYTRHATFGLGLRLNQFDAVGLPETAPVQAKTYYPDIASLGASYDEFYTVNDGSALNIGIKSIRWEYAPGMAFSNFQLSIAGIAFPFAVVSGTVSGGDGWTATFAASTYWAF